MIRATNQVVLTQMLFLPSQNCSLEHFLHLSSSQWIYFCDEAHINLHLTDQVSPTFDLDFFILTEENLLHFTVLLIKQLLTNLKLAQ